jgi:hypothetical protein
MGNSELVANCKIEMKIITGIEYLVGYCKNLNSLV